ncbi:MAG: hypothetical protein JO015_15505 [Verrucomicrobia bacterium]|nr:hypothetical protein [Verrucomicrobiota bacterium]
MKTIFAPLTAVVVLVMIVSIAAYLKDHNIAGSALTGTTVRAVARQWGKLNPVPVRAAAGVLSGLVNGVASAARATDGDPHVRAW